MQITHSYSFRDIDEGKIPTMPQDRPKMEVKDLTEQDIEAALERLTAYEEEAREENLKG